ncbi:MAG: hypothetical protein JWR26_4318 [Pedosphaera sp.]|nr:hypothetical protein [Pedosphaera sp.]
MDEFLNPHILTLDQALGISAETSAGEEINRQNIAKALMAIRDRVCCRFTGPDNINRLTYGERMVWDLTYMEGEVLNGGFHQYLTNSTGETSEDVKLYLQDIDAVQTLELFERLSKIFPGGKVPHDHEKRCAVVEEWEDLESGNDVFNELDGCFYRQSESLAALILAYVRMHRSDFLEPAAEIVLKLKRQDRIKAHYCSTAEPEWMGKAEAALDMLTQLVEAKQEQQNVEKINELKSMVKAGKRAEAIREYKKCFSCSLEEAKAAVDRLAKS